MDLDTIKRWGTIVGIVSGSLAALGTVGKFCLPPIRASVCRECEMELAQLRAEKEVMRWVAEHPNFAGPLPPPASQR